MEKRRVGTREKEGARESERTSSGSFKGNVTGSLVVWWSYILSVLVTVKQWKRLVKKKGGWGEDTRQDGRKARQMGSRGNYQGSSDGQRTIGWDQWQQKNGLCGPNIIAPHPFPPAGLNRSFFYFEVNLKIINQADSSHFFSSHLHFAVFLPVSLEPRSFLSSSLFFFFNRKFTFKASLLARGHHMSRCLKGITCTSVRQRVPSFMLSFTSTLSPHTNTTRVNQDYL